MNASRAAPPAVALAIALSVGPMAPGAIPIPEMGATKLRVLVVTGGHDFEPSFFKLFEEPWIDAVKVDQQATGKSFLAGDVEGFDAILLYDMWSRVTEADQKKLLGLLEKGQGLIVLHHAMADCQDWPAFAEISGGRFFTKAATWRGEERKISGYLHDVDYKVHVADAEHPIARGVKDFATHDETYKGYWVDRAAHVLLTTDEKTSEKAIAWTKTFGRSRIATIQMGHDGKAWSNPAFRTVLHNAIRWVSVPEGTVALFDGTSLKGWEKRGGAVWTVEDGVLVGKQGQPGNLPGDLFTRGEWGDFELKVVYRVVWPANSGIWFRFVTDEKCFQGDILEMAGAMSGSIYRPGKLFVARNPDASIVDRDGWNTMVIRAAGDRLEVTLNGKKAAEARDDLAAWGRIGFQVHPGDGFASMQIRVKEAVLTTLPAAK